MIFRLALSALLLGALAVMSCVVGNQRREIVRLSGNQDALLDSVRRYKTESGHNAAGVRVLELSKAELERNCGELARQVADLGVKLKRAESVAQTATQTALEFRAQVRDSIVYVADTLGERSHSDVLKTIEWRDPWVTFKGDLNGDVLTATMTSVDTLTTVLHRVPRKCWLFRWKTDEYRVEVVSSNPHTKIVHERYVKVRK